MDLAAALAALEQLNRAQSDALGRVAADFSSRRGRLAPAIGAGAKVFDLATGQVAEVIDGRRENHQVPAA